MVSHAILVKVTTQQNLNEKLTDLFYTDEKNINYMLKFNSTDKTKGVMIWRETFIVNFIRRGNIFIMFTGARKNYTILRVLLKRILGEETEVELLKVPLNLKGNSLEGFFIQNMTVVNQEVDKIVGVKFQLLYNNKNIFYTYDTTGYVIFTMTNNMETINKLIDISISLINHLLKLNNKI